MQIRATTVTNWDRQELVIPNKDLVTGKLLNWTLSNVINRVVINVGLAYGADAKQVREPDEPDQGITPAADCPFPTPKIQMHSRPRQG